MNILLINHYAGSPKLGMEYRPYSFAKEWIKNGHKVTIVASSYAHVRVKQPEVNKKISKELIDSIEYYWIKTPAYKGNGIERLLNIFSFISYLWRKSKFFIRKNNPDIVIASSTYPLDIYPAYRMAKLSGAKLVYEVHDLWPLTLIELGNMSKYNPLIILFQIAENFAYKKSDKIISILSKAKAHMQQHGLKPDKFVYIPNGINSEDWKNKISIPNSYKEKIDGLKKQNKFLICYAGAHGVANALDFFIKSATYLRDFPIHLLLIGKGPDRDKLIELAKYNNFNNVSFMEALTKKEVSSILIIMDVLYTGSLDLPIYRFGISPNKLLDYMMASKPIIQSIGSDNNLVTEVGCGLTVEPENSESIAKAIIKLYQMSQEERQKMGKAGRDYVLKNHEYKILAEKFLIAVK